MGGIAYSIGRAFDYARLLKRVYCPAEQMKPNRQRMEALGDYALNKERGFLLNYWMVTSKIYHHHKGRWDDDFEEAITAVTGMEKRVLLVTHELSNTGAPRALLTMAVTLKKLGYNPVLLSPKAGVMRDEYEAAGVLCVVPRDIAFDIVWETAGFYEFIGLFDTVLYNTLDSLAIADALHDLPMRRMVWIHEGKDSLYARSFVAPNFKRQFEAVDAVYMVSGYTKQCMMPYVKDGQPVDVLPYAIDDVAQTVPLQQMEENGRLKLLVAGVLCQRKGQELLIEAARQVEAVAPGKLDIYVVGGNADRKDAVYLRVMGTQLPYVHICGSKAHDELLAMMTGMDLLVCPSADDPLPIVCTEAMMLSKPVLVSDSTGTASLVTDGENGFVFKSGDVMSLCNALINIINHRDQLPECGRMARRVYESLFLPSQFAARVGEIFKV